MSRARELTPRQQLALGWGLWRRRARANQLAPTIAGWLVWLILAGRGWGKTRTGAEQAVRWALEHPGWRIALVAATFDDGRDVMVEGDSGVLSVLYRYGMREGKVPAPGVFTWNRSLGQLVLPNGSRMDLYSGNKPRQLRGPQHHAAWCDELPHWQYPRKTWNNLLYGLRLGDDPKVVVTTTPLPIPLLRELVNRNNTVVTKGSTFDNAANLAAPILQELREQFDGTEEGRQELGGELLDDVKGAMLTRAVLAWADEPVPVPELERLVVSVDPAVEDDPEVNDATGYAVVGVGYPTHPDAWHADLPHLYVMHTDQQWLDPTKAMSLAARLDDAYDTDGVVIEANNGGKYLPAVLRAVAPGIPFKVVKAAGQQDKRTRAQPLVALYQQRRVHHVGPQAFLSDELATWTGAKGQPSPNVMDAAVWGQHAVLPPTLKPGRRRRAATLHG